MTEAIGWHFLEFEPLVAALLMASGLGFIYVYFRDRCLPPLPPGPKGLPFVGNIMDMPPKGVPAFEHFHKLHSRYGSVFSVTVLGQTTVFLYERHAVDEIMRKMAVKTSGRPQNTFADMAGYDCLNVTQQYRSQIWQRHRRIIQQFLRPEKISKSINEVMDSESRRFLLRVLNDPKRLIWHLQTQTSSVILKVLYGYNMNLSEPDPLIQLMHLMMDGLASVSMLFSWVVGIFPILTNLPSWMPFKKKAKELHSLNELLSGVPFNFVKKSMTEGTHRPSFVSSHIEQYVEQKGAWTLETGAEYDIKSTAMTLFAGGSDTATPILSGFVLAMVMFPEVQKKAQAELDAVVGNRLPDLDDQSQLPYVSAVVSEALRWFPPTPMNHPHRVEEDIMYDGYRIPKNSLLSVGTRSLLHDPQTYADPDRFDPDRFITRNEPNPAETAFGFGRRACPGRHLAEKSLFLTISRLLATFDIQKVVEEGKEKVAKLEITGSLVVQPAEFPFQIVPRSDAAAEMVRKWGMENPAEMSDAADLTLPSAADFTGMLGHIKEILK